MNDTTAGATVLWFRSHATTVPGRTGDDWLNAAGGVGPENTSRADANVLPQVSMVTSVFWENGAPVASFVTSYQSVRCAYQSVLVGSAMIEDPAKQVDDGCRPPGAAGCTSG